MCLCFIQSSKAYRDGDISYSDHLDNLLAHCNGWASAKHEMDTDDSYGDELSQLKATDIFTWVIWKWSRNTSNFREDVRRDIDHYKEIFLAYPDVDQTIKLLETVTQERDVPYITLALAHRALDDRNGDMLRYCLEREMFTAYSFQEAADKFEADKIDPAICEILQKSKFRKQWPWPPRRNERNCGAGDIDVSVFDYGGEFEVLW